MFVIFEQRDSYVGVWGGARVLFFFFLSFFLSPACTHNTGATRFLFVRHSLRLLPNGRH